MKHFAKVAVAALVMSIAATYAHAQMQAPTPGPELKKLDYFLGDWKFDANMKPGPNIPGGKYISTDHAEWFEGRFFLVNHGKFTSPSGSGTEAQVYGYDATAKVYTFDSFNSFGEHSVSKGRLDGDTWTWMSEGNAGGRTFKTRFVEKIDSVNSYHFTFDMSQDGTSWTTVMDGTATRVSAGGKQN